jgi:hypothetical protein
MIATGLNDYLMSRAHSWYKSGNSRLASLFPSNDWQCSVNPKG